MRQIQWFTRKTWSLIWFPNGIFVKQGWKTHVRAFLSIALANMKVFGNFALCDFLKFFWPLSKNKVNPLLPQILRPMELTSCLRRVFKYEKTRTLFTIKRLARQAASFGAVKDCCSNNCSLKLLNQNFGSIKILSLQLCVFMSENFI